MWEKWEMSSTNTYMHTLHSTLWTMGLLLDLTIPLLQIYFWELIRCMTKDIFIKMIFVKLYI